MNCTAHCDCRHTDWYIPNCVRFVTQLKQYVCFVNSVGSCHGSAETRVRSLANPCGFMMGRKALWLVDDVCLSCPSQCDACHQCSPAHSSFTCHKCCIILETSVLVLSRASLFMFFTVRSDVYRCHCYTIVLCPPFVSTTDSCLCTLGTHIVYHLTSFTANGFCPSLLVFGS